MQKINNIEKFITKITTYGIIFLIATILICPIIGTAFSFFNIKWDIISALLILLAVVLVTYYFRNIDVFKIESITEWGILTIITAVAVVIYKEYAASLSVQQDQSIYIMKALNLVNYGFIYKPMPTFTLLTQNKIIDLAGTLQGYGNLENGNSILGDKMYTDFYAGGAYFYALCGLIKRNYTFYGQTLITIANTWLMYFTIKRVSKDKIKVSSGLYTLTFILSPICVWFGRSSSTETMALFLFLLIFVLLLSENMNNAYYLILPVTVALIGRIDYFLVCMVGIFIITYKNRIAGLIVTVTTSVFAFVCGKVFWIYYQRISANDMKIVKYQIPLFILTFIVTLIICKINKELICNIYKSKFVKVVVIIWGIAISSLMFRDLFISEENWGRFTEFGLNIRSYEECIMQHLFLVFPFFVILIGLIGAHKLLKSEHINMLAGIFVLALMVVYSYFVYKSGNAPQMYFLLRRYYNIFIPGVLILFAIFVSEWNEKTKIVIACICVLMSVYLLGDSKQQVEYAKLKKSVNNFVNVYNENSISTIFYNQADKYDISPIVAYGSYDVVPLQSAEELQAICDNNQLYDYENAIYITREPLENMVDYENIKLKYNRMGENYEELPTEYYHINVPLCVYKLKDLIAVY